MRARSVNRFPNIEIDRDWWVRLPLAVVEVALDWLPIAFMVATAWLGERVWSAYEARGIWYAEYGNSWAIVGAILVVGLCGGVAVGVFANPERRRRPLQWKIPAVLMLIAIGFIAVRWNHPGPTLEGARAAFHAGDPDRALAELDAVEQRWPGEPGAAELRSTLELARMRRLEKEPNSDDRLLARIADGNLATDTNLVLNRTWQDPQKRELARTRALARARVIADDAWTRGDSAALARVLEHTLGLDAAFTEQTKDRAAQLAAER